MRKPVASAVAAVFCLLAAGTAFADVAAFRKHVEAQSGRGIDRRAAEVLCRQADEVKLEQRQEEGRKKINEMSEKANKEIDKLKNVPAEEKERRKEEVRKIEEIGRGPEDPDEPVGGALEGYGNTQEKIDLILMWIADHIKQAVTGTDTVAAGYTMDVTVPNVSTLKPLKVNSIPSSIWEVRLNLTLCIFAMGPAGSELEYTAAPQFFGTGNLPAPWKGLKVTDANPAQNILQSTVVLGLRDGKVCDLIYAKIPIEDVEPWPDRPVYTGKYLIHLGP